MTKSKYTKLSHKEHILHRPGMYIGNVTNELKELYLPELDVKNLKFSKKEVEFNAGFIKIFDEILTNASDHYIRTNEKVKRININITEDTISIDNDGPGIPIELHEDEKVYIPELIFGHLLTGENYNDDEQRIVGGTYGLGAKLTNIYSKKFEVECVDGVSKYIQTFYNNLTRKSKPKITKAKRPYTKITYTPDFERFGLEKITDEIKQIFLKRAVDVAVYCPKVKVYFNDVLIPMSSFKDYVKMYVGENDMFHEVCGDNWEIGLAKSTDDQFEQVSMVNGIFTYDGGTHVTYITNQISKKISEALKKKHKDSRISQTDIERNLFVFVNCKIPNPAFSSQTKEKLITKLLKDHKLNSEVSDNFIKKVLNSEIVDSIIRYIEAKEAAKLKNQSGSKKIKVKVKKLDDANRAGSVDSNKCSLFLTEGDSASSMVLSGIEKKDKDYFGIFPLKGKPLNVRDVSMTKIMDNEEIKNIINILGLEFGKKYTDTKSLRYGKVVLLTDADCISENTLVRTKLGDKYIKDLNYDDEVLTSSDKYQKILNIIETKKDKYVEITVNGEIFKFGEYHKIYVNRDGNIIEIYAKDILSTDLILIKK